MSVQAGDTPTVSVWLTLPDESKRLSVEPDITFAADAQPSDGAYVIQLDDAVTYQRMEGFGAAMTDSSAFLLMRVLTDAQREQVMRRLFTRDDGIGISYVRIPIGASDFALHDYNYAPDPDPDLSNFSINYDEAYIIPALQRALALNPALRFMASPWSAPGWMKDTRVMGGGTLLPEYYPAFARYLVRFIQAYAAHGIVIDTITPQNEPQHSTTGYPTMLMPAEGQQAFVRDHLAPALRAAGLNTRIVIFDHNWDLYQYPLDVLADPATAAVVDGVAFHCYGGDVSAQSRVRDAFPDKGIWFTECSGGEWATSYPGNLSWNLHHLVVGNIRNWGNSLLLWNLALDENFGPTNGGCRDCRGVVTISQSDNSVSYNVEYDVLGHLSKAVDPGAYRIDSTAFVERQPENVAFRNPDGSIVLVVHATQAVTFTVVWRGSHFLYDLPAGAVVTFRWGG